MIFSRDYGTDRVTKGSVQRYFDLDAPKTWDYSRRCVTCDKHLDVYVFFNQQDLEANHDLVEITDK